MDQALQLQLLRAANLLICIVGIHPSVRLLRVADAMEKSDQKKVAKGFRMLAYGFIALTVGNALMIICLIYQRAAQSLLPGYWMAITNTILVAGMFALYKLSQEEEDQ